MPEKKTILFVCQGNMFRSPFAALYLKKLLKEKKLDKCFAVKSAGLAGAFGSPKPKYRKLKDYPRDGKLSISIAKKFNIDMSKHFRNPLTESLLKKTKIIIAFDRLNLYGKPNGILYKFPPLKKKTFLLNQLAGLKTEIQDPFQKSRIFYQKTAKKIVRYLKTISMIC